MADKPVTVSGLILTLALAILAVAAYYLKLTPEEMALWSGVLAAGAALLHWWLSRQTTPAAKPVDDDGVPLVRADDGQPSSRAAAAGRYVVKARARGGAPGEGATTPEWNK